MSSAASGKKSVLPHPDGSILSGGTVCKAASASNVHPNQELELIDIKGKLSSE